MTKWKNNRKWTNTDEYEVLVVDPRLLKELDPLSPEERAEVSLSKIKNTKNQAK